jgi:hypothetical protein
MGYRTIGAETLRSRFVSVLHDHFEASWIQEVLQVMDKGQTMVV